MRLAEANETDPIVAINQRIFESSVDLILVTDRKGNILRVSPSSMAIVGYAPEEMIGRTGREFIYADDVEATRQEMRLARRGQHMRNFDCRYLHKSGAVVPVVWTGVWSEAEQQHFFIGRDMTERVKLESQLRHAQKMEAIGQLTGGVAHDFNNILTVVSGSIEILAEAIAGDPKLAALAKSIDEAADRGAQLTQRMLAFARRQALHSRTLDLNEVVKRAAAILHRTLGEDISIRIALADDLWPATADQSQLEDAILNLAVNARDAMPNGGELVIETANVHLDEQYAGSNNEVTAGDYAAVIVTDSGTGMPKEVIERAFDPFFTTKDIGRGTGLGLSMVYGFVKQSRGHVKIYSELDHGTSIRVYLPRSMDAVAAASAAEAVVSPSGGKETILVVEDDPAVRKVVVTLLESLGYRVVQAGDGQTALDTLLQTDTIDLLFTDLIMPGGMNGQELLRHARQMRPGLRALFTSGYSEQFLKGRDGTDENVPLVGKPYRRQRLAEAVRIALDRPA